MRYFLAITFCLALLSCSSDTMSQTDSVPQTADSEKASSTFTKDPWFVETNDTFAAGGPTNITRDIIQGTKRPDFWIASWEGLWRMRDGKYINVTLTEGLAHCRVFSLCEDSKGNLWIGTMGAGVYCYDGETYTQITEADGLINNFVECIAQDRQGRIWFGTNAGVSAFTPDSIHPPKGSFRNYGGSTGITGVVHTIAADQNGTIWVGSDDGAFTLKEERFVAFPMNSITLSYFRNVRSIYCDDYGIVWIGGSDGMYRYDNKSGNKKDPELFMKNFTSYLRSDREGHILASVECKAVGNTGMMLLNIRGNMLDTLAIRGSHNDQQIFGSFRAGTEEVWFGTMQGVSNDREE